MPTNSKAIRRVCSRKLCIMHHEKLLFLNTKTGSRQQSTDSNCEPFPSNFALYQNKANTYWAHSRNQLGWSWETSERQYQSIWRMDGKGLKKEWWNLFSHLPHTKLFEREKNCNATLGSASRFFGNLYDSIFFMLNWSVKGGQAFDSTIANKRSLSQNK